jgi:hypothetical protein
MRDNPSVNLAQADGESQPMLWVALEVRGRASQQQREANATSAPGRDVPARPDQVVPREALARLVWVTPTRGSRTIGVPSSETRPIEGFAGLVVVTNAAAR